MSSKTLPGITIIEFISADEIILSPKKFLVPGSTTKAVGEFTKINMVDLASCVTTSERTSPGLVYTTKVGGVIYEDENMDNKQQNILSEKFHCYRLTDVYKNKYLVGIDKKPFPEISFTPSIESAPSGLRAINFEISWVSTLPPLELIIL